MKIIELRNNNGTIQWKYKDDNESITYDAIGNPLTMGDKTFTWRNGRELASYSDTNNNVSYIYNNDGIRTSKTVNNVTTNYYLKGNKIVFEEKNNTMLYFIYNNDELVGFKYNGNTYHYHKNLFGDVIGIYDSNNNEIVTYEYDSWGAIVNIIDNSNINLSTINPFRYRSYYYDEETKLYYLNSRYYNPLVGRFINADGIINANSDFISGNLYQYVSNNPVVLKDNKGSSATIAGGVGVATFAPEVLATAAKTLTILLGILVGGAIIEETVSDRKTKVYYDFKIEEEKHSIYTLTDSLNNVVYVGRTNDFARRQKEHKKNPDRSSYIMEEIRTTNSLSSAIALEQYYINLYKTKNTGIKGCNKRNEISPKSKKIEYYRGLLPEDFDVSVFDSETYVGEGYCVF